MRRDLLSVPLLLVAFPVALVGCPGGGARVGESCGSNDDCDRSLQCFNDICTPRCERAPQCGDGYACTDGLCAVAHGQSGDTCLGESDCAAGRTCQINGAEIDPKTNRLAATCALENPLGHPTGDLCSGDADCRNGTCDLGHCVDLCRDTTDCALGTSCMTIPRVAVNGELFEGCLPTQGTVSWDIPVVSPSAQILLPVPSGARSAALVMSVDDPGQKVGAESVLDPCGCTRYTAPCSFLPQADPTTCTALLADDQFYSRDPNGSGTAANGGSIAGDAGGNICGSPVHCNDSGGPMVNRVRHRPEFGHSVLLIPSIPSSGELKNGAYQIQVSSFWPDNSPGSAVPHVTAVVRNGTGNQLDLHFFFLDLEDHPCAAMAGIPTLAAGSAPNAPGFQAYLNELGRVFGRAGMRVNAASYQDFTDRHALDGVDVTDIGSLFALGTYATGINVFFVRSLSPLGVEVFGPTPGPAGVTGAASGIAISFDTLCYRDWPAVARLTAHAIGHYMGLYHNVEPPDPVQGPNDPPWEDLVPDTDTSGANLMYFSQTHAGSDLTVEQSNILSWSPVLR